MMQLQPACEELYHNMVSEVYSSQRPNLSPASRVTLCFKICMEHWSRLKDLMKAYNFVNDEEEIWFFKVIKPKFTALIEYYTMVYHAELFMPSLNEENIHTFWKKEKEKIKKFYQQNEAFYEYYKSGDISMDYIYFLRKNAEGCQNCYNKLYDTDNSLATTHGNTVSALLAYDMYDAYIMQQVKKVDDHISL
jgi:hypothetical protein